MSGTTGFPPGIDLGEKFVRARFTASRGRSQFAFSIIEKSTFGEDNAQSQMIVASPFLKRVELVNLIFGSDPEERLRSRRARCCDGATIELRADFPRIRS